MSAALLTALLLCRAAGAAPVAIIELDGSIQPGSLRYLARAIEEADAQDAAVTILRLDTPGGLLVSLRDMTTVITQARRPVVVWVAPPGAHAASAGFFLLLAGDVAVMAPGTTTGSAHPVAIGPQGEAPEDVIEKVTNDAAALARSLAANRKRPVALAEDAVRKSTSWTEREAREVGLIDFIAQNEDELLRGLDGRRVRRLDGSTERLDLEGASVMRLEPTYGEKLLMAIADPDVAYILLMIGLLGLFIELMHPGALVPGIVGGISLLLALYASSVLPVSLVGVLLLLAAVGFFVAEAFVTSYGALTVAGLGTFIVGSVMLFDASLPSERVSLWLVVPVAVVLAGAVTLLLGGALRRRRRPSNFSLVGERGEVVVPLAPEGTVFVHGEYWDAVAPAPLPRGAAVRVVAVNGNRLEVEEGRSP